MAVERTPGFTPRASIPHLFLPALTAMIIGLPLSTLQASPFWWVVFAFGGLLFVMVIASEYIALDNQDSRHAAGRGHTYCCFLGALPHRRHLCQCRGHALLSGAGHPHPHCLPGEPAQPALPPGRKLELRLGGSHRGHHFPGGTWAPLLPCFPLGYGLILLGAAYALTSVAGSVIEHRSWRMALGGAGASSVG